MKSNLRIFVVPGDEVVLNIEGSVDIDWGDGTSSVEGSGEIIHLYEDAIGVTKITLAPVSKTTLVRSENGLPAVYRQTSSGWDETVIGMTLRDGIILGNSAFEGCKDLKTVKLEFACCCDNSEYALASSGIERLTIRNVRNIAPAMFYDCRELTHVLTDDYIESIGGNAFCGCTNLDDYRTYNQPNTITAKFILNEAFMYTGLSKTMILCCETIGPLAFNNCNAKGFVLHGTKTVEYRAFASCRNLKQVAVTKDTKPVMHVEAIGIKRFNLGK